MHHDQFLGKVQAAARLPDRGEAERATRATLETLGERIPNGLAENLAAQLPHEIGEHLRRAAKATRSRNGERFDKLEFIARVAARAGVNETRGAALCHAVSEVVDEATGGMIGTKVAQSLPHDIAALLMSGLSASV
jgi:uncharacterized protein (DUF2267 family)